MKNKFDKTYHNILKQINVPFLKVEEFSFNEAIKKLIVQDYHTFPVPKTLLDDIENFIYQNIGIIDLNNEKFIQKKYMFKDLLNKYTKNWQYYEQFLENIQLALNKNSKCSLVVCLFVNEKQAQNILKTYNCKNVAKQQIFNSKAMIYSYDQDKNFNACLCINATLNDHIIRKAIQHQLIHWMQVSLNSHTKKSYGIFNDVKFNLGQNQLDLLSFASRLTNDQFVKTYEYLLDGKQFEAWVANTCEQFNNFHLTIQKFQNIVENQQMFKRKMIFSNSLEQKQMYLFGRICYSTSKHNSKDDRYWYLIEALKQNENE